MIGMGKRLGWALGCVAAFALAACAEAPPPPPSQPAVLFPDRAEVAAIAAQKPRLEAFADVDTSATAWTVHVEAKAEDAPYDDPSAWGEFLRAAVQPHGQAVILSAPLKCASEELATFARRSQRLPPRNLMRFIVARCGAMVTAPQQLTWGAAASASVTDGMLLEAARKKLRPALEALLARASEKQRAGGPPLAVGLGVVRDDTGVSVAITVGVSEATVDATPLRADAKHQVSVEGTVHGEYRSIEALVNRGDAGFAGCLRLGDVAPPRFAFRCQLADGDAYAWVDIMGRRPGLELSRVLASGVVTAGGDAPVVFKSRSDAAPAVVHTPAELSAAIAEGVNRARAVAHLAPVAVDARQSTENARLAGTLINAANAANAASTELPKDGSNRAALGLLAGWDVAGVIRGGKLVVGAYAPTQDAAVWLDWTLERPAGRAALLDPASRVIAIGAAVPEASALGAVVTTYALFDSADHRRDEAAVYKRIDAARAARGLPPARFIAGFPEMHEHALRVLTEGANPSAEMRAMLSVAQTRSGESVRGAVIETTSVEDFTLPDVALAPGEVHLAVAVTHHRVPGGAWGQYVVFFVAVGESGGP